MDFAADEDVKLLQKAVREFSADVVAPLARDMEKTGRMSPELSGALAAQGLLGISIPPAYGGTRLSSLERLVALEEVARVSPACAAYLAAQHTAAAALFSAGGGEELLPALAAGRGPAALALPAPAGITWHRTEVGSCRLDGQTAWCQGAARPAWFLVEAWDDSGDPAFFVLSYPATGVELGTALPAGLRGSQAGPLSLNDARPAPVWPGERARLTADRIVAVHALGFAATALGLMQAALDAALDFARKRVLYGRPIAQLQSVQFRLADMFADLEAGRLMTYRAAFLFDRDRATPLDLYSLHRYMASAAVRIARKAVEVFGGYGALKDFPVERCLRDAQALSAGGFPVHLACSPTVR